MSYLASVWQNRNRFLEESEELSEEEEQERKIQKQRFFDFTVDGKISARNFVGVVQYENIRIEVYPKIYATGEEHDFRKYQLNLFYWLSYCRKLKFPFSFADVSKFQFDDYLELLIFIFANFTETVLSSQPFQDYETVDEETTFLKGRLSFDNYTKHNLITGKWLNFYCTHQPFIYDNLFNRTIKYVTKRLSAITLNNRNREKLSEILFLLHDVEDVSCKAEDCDKIRLNPLYSDHKDVLNLCKLFLSNQVIDMESEDSKNFCFLLPMEYIFEDFIFGFIATKWPSLPITSQGKDFLALSGDKNVFQIRNDIYIKDTLVIDTKYKIRPPNDGLKGGVAQSDMYQMVSYAVARNCRNVLLLYPYNRSGVNYSTCFKIPSAILLEEIEIAVHNIDITFEDIETADFIMQERFSAVNSHFE